MKNTLTIDDILDTVKSFIVNTLGIEETWRTQDNRVPMSKGLSAYLTPLFFKRLTTTRSEYQDTGNSATSTINKTEIRTLDIQVDIYGDGAGDKAIELETLFRDSYGVENFHLINKAITPLYASSVQQNIFFPMPSSI